MGSTVPLSVLASKASSARIFAKFLISTSLSTTSLSHSFFGVGGNVEVADDAAPDACCDAAMVATIPVGPTLQAGVSLPVLLLAVPPTVHTLPEPMGPVATLPVGPTESLVLVPVHLIAVVGCAPVLVLEIAVPTRARATATSTVATSAAVAAAAPPALAAAADEDGIVGTASPSCMDSRVSVRGLTRTRQRVIPRWCMCLKFNPHPPTGYTSLVDGCDA